MNKKAASSATDLKTGQKDMQIRDEDSNFFSETIALQTNESVGGGPPESEEEEEETSRE